MPPDEKGTETRFYGSSEIRHKDHRSIPRTVTHDAPTRRGLKPSLGPTTDGCQNGGEFHTRCPDEEGD